MITTLDTVADALTDSLADSALPAQPGPLFPARTTDTPWRCFDLQDLAAGVNTVAEGVDEESGYLVLDGQARVEQAGRWVDVTAPAVVCCATGTHGLQAGPQGARLIRFAIDAGGATGGSLRSDQLAVDRLPWRDAIHGGGGRIGTRHLWRPQEFVSSLTFIDHAVLSQGSSLGFHYHDHLEEAFVVLSGRGWMTFAGDGGATTTVEIGAGSVTWQAANIGHGLYNPFAHELDFVRIAVATPGAAYTTIDLDNDLRQCRPTQEAP